MVVRVWECAGLVVVGSVRRGLTSSRHNPRKGTASGFEYGVCVNGEVVIFRGEGCNMVVRVWECVGLVVVGSVRRGLTSSRHNPRKGTASARNGTQDLIVFVQDDQPRQAVRAVRRHSGRRPRRHNRTPRRAKDQHYQRRGRRRSGRRRVWSGRRVRLERRRGSSSSTEGEQLGAGSCSKSATTEETMLEAVLLLTKAFQQNPQQQQQQQQQQHQQQEQQPQPQQQQ